MMKKILNNLAVLLSSLTLLSFCLTSCKSFFNNNQKNEVNFVDIVVQSDSYAGINDSQNNSARTASVVKPDNVYYVVTAYGTDTTEKQLDPVTQDEPVVGVELTYHLELESGFWTFEVYGYENKEKATSKANAILYGKTTEPITCNGGRYYKQIPVAFTKKGNGSVKLEIDASKVTIDKLKISGTGIALDDDKYEKKDGKIIIEKDNLKSGTYNAKMDFYTNDVLLYSTEEIINITDNLVVENWIYSGGKDYLVRIDEEDSISAAAFILTPELITKNKNNYCYVAESKAYMEQAFTSVKTPADSNTGSGTAPYKTLQAAFNRTMALNTEFKNAEKQQREFIIYVAGTVAGANTSTTTTHIENDNGDSYKLSIIKYGSSDTKPTITGNISIGQNIPTTISSISMDGLTSNSKLTLSNCTLSGKAPFEITNVSDESVITNTIIGSASSSSNITFTNSTVTISNTKNHGIYAKDFTSNHTLLNMSCNSTLTNDRFTFMPDTFIIQDSNGTENGKITLRKVAVSANNDFTLKNSSNISLSNITISVPKIITENILGTSIDSSTFTISGTDCFDFKDSQIDFTSTKLNGTLKISGTATETNAQRKVTFSKSGTVASAISGNGITVSNSTVEFTDSSSITSSGIITFENNSKIKLNNSAKIDNTTTSINISNCTTEIDKATLNVNKITAGDSTASGATKSDNLTINESTVTTEKEGQLTFNSSNVSITKSTINGPIFVSNDNLTLEDTTLNGDIGKAAVDNSPADGIDTDSKVILAGTTVLPSYTSGSKVYNRTIYVEDKAILYTKNLPAKEASPATIATISALYPTKDEVILVNLNNDNKEIDYDNTFIVSGAASSTPIDERFKLDSAGYYLDYRVPTGDTIRKGVIKESSVELILPETGGFTLEIAENDNITVDANGHIVISKDNLADTPIKVIIKNSSKEIVDANITYQLYREATPIGSSVTSTANPEGITISGERIEQELQFASKVTYFLKVTFTDNVAKLLYSDLFIVDIVKD
jgi:hypothetical protein